MGRTNLSAFIRGNGHLSFTAKFHCPTGMAVKQDVITASPEITQWVDEVWSRNFGATSQAILKSKPLEFSPEETLKMDQDALRPAATAYLSDTLQREGLDFTTEEGHQRAQMLLSSFLNQAMQEAMGIEFYVWASQHDKRVRATHADRNGKIFRWDTPPEGGHPSQDYGCRCYAQPFSLKRYYALVQDTLDAQVEALDRWEGSVDHMYLDSRGNVTVGVGTMLPDADSAAVLPFRYRSSGLLASESDIRSEFTSVSEMEQTGNTPAEYYAPLTQLYLSDTTIQILKRNHVNEDFEKLIKIFPNFGNFPESAQLALLDMIYNLGSFREFPKLRRSVLAEDWVGAANESERGGPSSERNAYVFNLFLDAAD